TDARLAFAIHGHLKRAPAHPRGLDHDRGRSKEHDHSPDDHGGRGRYSDALPAQNHPLITPAF
ncbi:MAG TPA: hypothetical protein VLV15_12110, partial [Dongiaceae bacterium]|nr:hypothetical protein [Dongiaceae bacterium]